MNQPVRNQPSTASSAIDDLRGLVMGPIAVAESADETSTERDSSSWTQLVRPELCGGLAARARFLRGKMREREVRLAGLDPNSPSVVCVQIQFKNKYVFCLVFKTDLIFLTQIQFACVGKLMVVHSDG